ncbi:NUDIX hydrolase [Alkalilimnicola ehrlichii MLHE-1]|uniref:Phosphatase NudJ n=1 Tax=Alkalilimnicola ehrlichii (strain ATCC BAA-1101 / DSM 17681 / MLHE-1) TaxID=187272 RepID=Q0A8N8_ALKEH|nr:NUDIX hydrolase [Alkalilimnicola ehrlichii]ABI56799.1 NUDIX hydrolase [Alkalilimnicola ehrlichii MLHE-1]
MVWKPHVTVAAVVEWEGRFLMVEERPEGDAVVYNQPAGHLDPGESLTHAVIRETREETAWGFQPEALVGVYLWQPDPADTERSFLRIAFTGSLTEHDPNQALDQEIIRTCWKRPEELEAHAVGLRSPLVMRCIRDYQAGHRYPLALLGHLLPPGCP